MEPHRAISVVKASSWRGLGLASFGRCLSGDCVSSVDYVSSMEMQSGYTILDHPADLGLEATGTSLATAFAHAGLALISVIVDPAGVLPTTLRTLEVRAEDAEQLLVRWLDEILFQYDSGGFIPGEITVESISPTHLTATIRGELLDPGRHTSRLDVKAITYHQIEVREDDRGGFVRVFLDI